MFKKNVKLFFCFSAIADIELESIPPLKRLLKGTSDLNLVLKILLIFFLKF